MKLGIQVLAIVVIFAIGIAGWFLKREVNSFLYYDSASKDVVCQMVKPEYLKNAEECE